MSVFAASLIHWLCGSPAENVVYERFRDAEKSGQVQFVINAPVPYSASDRLRDQLDPRLLPPSRQHWLGTRNSARMS